MLNISLYIKYIKLNKNYIKMHKNFKNHKILNIKVYNVVNIYVFTSYFSIKFYIRYRILYKLRSMFNYWSL